MRRRESAWLRRLSTAVLGLTMGLLPLTSLADHEVSVALKEIEASIRATFDAFNREDVAGFLDGWTDRGFLNKTVFRLQTDKPFAKDETPIVMEAIRSESGPIRLTRISNVKIHDYMVIQGSADVELVQGHVLENYRLAMVKRLGVDKRWKIQRDELLPVVPDGFPVVRVNLTEYAIDLDQSRLARNMVLGLVNTGAKPHEFVLFKRHSSGRVEASIARGAWALAPGATNQVVLTGLEPGPYLMTCCTVDPDHKPHCNKGMRVEVTIP